MKALRLLPLFVLLGACSGKDRVPGYLLDAGPRDARPMVDLGSVDATAGRGGAGGADTSPGGVGGGGAAGGGAGAGGLGGLTGVAGQGSAGTKGGAPGSDGGVDAPPMLDAPVEIRIAQGQGCTSSAQCAIGLACTDGVCCAAASCGGPCFSCAAPGEVAGVCRPLRSGSQPPACANGYACSADGRCLATLGHACTTPGDCSSGYCVDGACCQVPSCGELGCSHCLLDPGPTGGSCQPLADATETTMCSDVRACFGGHCGTKLAGLCNTNSECGSGHCVDGVCCNSACSDTCYACNQPGAVGTCTPLVLVPDPRATVACGDSNLCAADGSARCLLIDSQPCTDSDQCASGNCATVYYDWDQDGYGATAYPTTGTTPVKLCASETTKPPTTGSFRGGDCCDSDPESHPGIVSFLSSPNKCGSWDANCNGAIEGNPNAGRTCIEKNSVVLSRCGDLCDRTVNTGPTGTGSRYEILWSVSCR